jgi:hypothetical protein
VALLMKLIKKFKLMLTNNDCMPKIIIYIRLEAIARPRIRVPNTDPTNSYFYTHIELHPHIT